ncbi:MAG: cobalamin biosynthesis protein [Rhodospirillales bacterium]|nr:cobalamin biosynthesis protein [Rhodospirillales bacterium]
MTLPGAEALTIILLALVGDGIIAGLPGFRHVLASPIAGMAALSRWFDGRLNRPQRSASNRKFRGAIAALLMLGLGFGIGNGLEELVSRVPRGWMWEVLLATTMLTQRRGMDTSRNIRKALDRNEPDAARSLLGREVSYDTSHEDAHGLARGAIETCAIRFCDGAVAPVFWYVVLGLPGLIAFRAINVMAHALGDRSGAFGMTAARLDRVFNIVLAPICGVVISVSAAFAPTANPVQAFKVMGDAVRGRGSLVAPWTMGAMAGALGLALGGPRRDGAEPWIGDGRARALPQDIGRAIFIYAVAGMITAGAILLLALYAAGR